MSPENQSPTDQESLTVWVLCVVHKHGRDFLVYGDEDKAQTALTNYCRYWWDEEDLGPKEGLSDDELVEKYFEDGQEYYDLVPANLNEPVAETE